MKVERVWEAPRVTKPYTDAQWSAIDALGARIDIDLKKNDVRLTQGGEPTFVSVDDRDGVEWNTAALGPTKRHLGASLLTKLKSRYAPRGLLHYGQGKWYPGEQLPRWSLNLYWRKDGEPVWKDASLFANEAVDYGVTEAQAKTFLEKIAQRLALNPQFVFPAYEDVWYYLWRERKLPVNVDPFDARLEDEMERKRLRKVFTQGLDKIAGFVLPLKRAEADAARGGARWQSGPWFLRAERCYLIPGDSPVGYRVPLDSQPWTSKGDYPYQHQPDPTQAFPALPAYATIRRQAEGDANPQAASMALKSDLDAGNRTDAADAADAAAGLAPDANLRATTATGAGQRNAGDPPSALVATDAPPASFQSAGWITRTSMCAEVRNGKLYLFMPPVVQLEDYLDVTAAIEATAEEMKLPVILEGYEPPRDPRITILRVTPDPGVLEVNIQPAKTWGELTDLTTFLYDAAFETRLSSEKFMLDGRHAGTGGGNHFVLGAETPLDSPFLRRPDLLASMVGYWHNHPALSYLFSGMFIGPTSQAPRIDEARNESVYEIEIAFREIARLSGLDNALDHSAATAPAPWVIDRILRNLLTDITGNTHRAEFCIDKLYSPDSATGRLGLLEMRAFEMPPNARMSLTQQLLMRALIARFWQHPYKPPVLKRWGTELHDRFMLPYFIWDDLAGVIEELNDFGYGLKTEWFAPHFEFRFPKLGDFTAKGVHTEVRMALEPWNVLGEEGSSTGTARYVDSSVERVQVHVTGLVDDRHILTCNGRPVPLHPTGKVGEFAAGVRYRAWCPPSSLHPTIGPHAPLVFDLVDTWMGRSLGGCQYHVAHPGGRSYDSFPVNAFEAEARRLARFFRTGHTPGEMRIVPEERNPNYPFTLDIRRAPR